MTKMRTVLSCGFAVVALFVCIATQPVQADTLATTDAGEVASFQSGAVVVSFDSFPGNAISYFVPITEANRVSDQFQNLGVMFSSTGGPLAAVFAPSDARSDPNVVGGSSNGPIVDYYQPIRVDFVVPGTSNPGVTDRVGAWNDPTGSQIRLSVYSTEGQLLATADANQGFFVGISNVPRIAYAVFTDLTPGGDGFSLDDITFTTPTTVPEPAGLGVFLLGLPLMWRRRDCRR